jgi:DUF4097 and DUF4098 domain-containing protein YvlB
MKKRMFGMFGVAALLAFPAAAAAEDFQWRGRLAAGKTVEIKGVNGAIDASLAQGDEVEVTATKRSRKSHAEDVRIEAVEHAGGVTVCAVYPDLDGGRNECGPGEAGRMRTRNNDTEVHFTVRLPRGVRFMPKTVNGDVEAEGLESDVDASTVNGSIQVATSGRAEARTVNGSIRAQAGRADWTGDAAFKTVNGSITLTLPASAGAEVRAETVNGEIQTDFPLTVTGRISKRRLAGTIGGGGRTLELETVNGSIHLRKSS